MTHIGPTISIIAGIGKNRELGRGNKLLWRIPDDLKRFKILTAGHPIVMGRKTFESIGKSLPGRINIIVTHDPNWSFESTVVATSLEEALTKARKLDTEEIFIIGGAQIYEQALPYADRLYLTLIDDQKDGDTYFPAYETIFTKKIFEEDHEHNGLTYRWTTLER